MQHPEYAHLIICNNDLLVPSGTVRKLEEALEAGWSWLLPMTSTRGTHYDLHRLHDHFPNGIRVGNCHKNKVAGQVRGCPSDWTDQPMHFQDVQNILDSGEPALGGRVVASTVANYNPAEKGIRQVMNGYMMAFNKKRMLPHQFDHERQLLFNPANVNVNNEDGLVARLFKEGDVSIGIHTGAFVFHYKGYTLFAAEGRDRNVLGEKNYRNIDG